MMKFKTMDCGSLLGTFEVPTCILPYMGWGNHRSFCCVKHAEQYFQKDKDRENLSVRDFIFKYNELSFSKQQSESGVGN